MHKWSELFRLMKVSSLDKSSDWLRCFGSDAPPLPEAALRCLLPHSSVELRMCRTDASSHRTCCFVSASRDGIIPKSLNATTPLPTPSPQCSVSIEETNRGPQSSCELSEHSSPLTKTNRLWRSGPGMHFQFTNPADPDLR
jgi:hypothetical protein